MGCGRLFVIGLDFIVQLTRGSSIKAFLEDDFKQSNPHIRRIECCSRDRSLPDRHRAVELEQDTSAGWERRTQRADFSVHAGKSKVLFQQVRNLLDQLTRANGSECRDVDFDLHRMRSRLEAASKAQPLEFTCILEIEATVLIPGRGRITSRKIEHFSNSIKAQ